MMAVFLIVVLQLDMLDYLVEQISIPSLSVSEQIIQNGDEAQEEGNDSDLSFQRSRSIQKSRIRIIFNQKNGWNEFFVDVQQNYSFVDYPPIIHQVACSFRTLFCVFRI